MIRVDDFELESLGFWHYTGFVLALVSAVIHFYLGFQIGLQDFLGPSFIFAGIGFVAGIVLVLVDYRRGIVYLSGILFTLGQIVSWYWINRPSLAFFVRGEPFLDFVDKVAQALLVVILFYLYRVE